ncbi:MAG: hypothetical protein ABI354_02045 [Candidatus Saccharimonadales bacterium]
MRDKTWLIALLMAAGIVIILAIIILISYMSSESKPASQLIKKDPVQIQGESINAITKTQSKGSDLWVNTMLNNAIFYADNGSCDEAKSILKEVKSTKQGDYKLVETRIAKCK